MKFLPKIKHIIPAAILLTGWAWAQDGTPAAGNEDLQFIRDWQRSQLINELAVQMALTPEQVTTLTETRAEVDAIKAEFEPVAQGAKDELAAVAAAVRANIEATDTFTAEDQEALRQARRAVFQVRREQRMSIALALGDLEGLLTEAQQDVVKQVLQQFRPGDDRPDKQARNRGGEQGNDRARGDREGRGGNKAARMLIRLMLSDEFLAHYA